MRNFIGFVVLAIAYINSSCSSTEPVQQESQPESTEDIRMAPAWYTDGVNSSSDSLTFNGYSLASAVDSSEAVDLSTKTALEYLRFEIDRTAEEIRKDLSESVNNGEKYTAPEFILGLRQSIREMKLNNANTTHEYELSESGVYYVYTRASIPRFEIYSLLENHIQDTQFLQRFRD